MNEYNICLIESKELEKMVDSVIKIKQIPTCNDERKVDEKFNNKKMNAVDRLSCGHEREESKIELGSMSNKDWDEYWASSPTVRIDSTFQPITMADYLHGNLTTKDKKQKKKVKRIVIEAMTNLTNDQRQTLFETYRNRFEGRNLGQDIKDALGKKGKGKSLYAVLVLLQTPAQFVFFFFVFVVMFCFVLLACSSC